MKSLSQKQTILDLSSLKIPNAQYWKKDHDDNQGDQGFGGNGNPIMWGWGNKWFFFSLSQESFFDNLYITLKKLFYEMGLKKKLIDFI